MLKMKLILSLVAFCLVLNNGMGLPRGRYKYVRCNPSGGQANCVTYQSPPMELTPDLPSRLPSSATNYIEGEPEEGSGGYEGSGGESPLMVDWPFMGFEPDTGSGESWTEDQTEQNGNRGNEDARDLGLTE